MITLPDVQKNKIRFVVASGSKTIKIDDVKRRVEDFRTVFTLPFTLKQVRVSDKEDSRKNYRQIAA